MILYLNSLALWLGGEEGGFLPIMLLGKIVSDFKAEFTIGAHVLSPLAPEALVLEIT